MLPKMRGSDISPIIKAKNVRKFNFPAIISATKTIGIRYTKGKYKSIAIEVPMAAL